MRAVVWVAAVLVVVSPPACAAQEADARASGLARSVSLLFFVGSTCPAFDRIDVELVGRYAKAEDAVGVTAIGERAFGHRLAEEVLRRGREVDATGARRWCAIQKEKLRGLGLTAFYR